MSKICEYEHDLNHEFFGCDTCLHNMKLEQNQMTQHNQLKEDEQELDEILDFIENYGVRASTEGFDKTSSRNEAKAAIQAHTNAEIAKVLDRLTVADNISDRACSQAIEAERAKLKEVK